MRPSLIQHTEVDMKYSQVHRYRHNTTHQGSGYGVAQGETVADSPIAQGAAPIVRPNNVASQIPRVETRVLYAGNRKGGLFF
jgi:hypothetical protein